MRGIYNTGKRGVFFMNYGIFAAQDISFPSDSVVLRSVTTLLYDHIVNEKFSFRIGYSKTFILGNRFRLPYLGFRVGRLDKTYLSVQFPRNITLSFPMGSKFRGALFTKPMGGLYTFANTDTLYYMGNEKKIHFGWREISSGLKLEYYPGKNFSFNLSMGTATNGIIGMSSFGFNRNKFNALQPFYFDRLDKRGFVYVGMTLRFGKAKKVYNSRNIYEVFDLNNTIDAGDNNSDPGNGNIPKSTKKNKIRNLQISDVQDLIETQDLY